MTKTTGVGAFTGMVIGALLMLPLGPIYALAGGLLGAIIGDYLEYEYHSKRGREVCPP